MRHESPLTKISRGRTVLVMNSCAKLVAMLVIAVGLIASGGPILADGAPPSSGTVRGAVTSLPVPRFVSLKARKANVRRGPSLSHRVDWVFTKENMPLEITAEFGNWRRVRDVDGQGGWVHYSLLSGVRTVIVEKDYTPLRSKRDIGARPNAYAEQGVVAFLGACKDGWCNIRSGSYRGWVLQAEIWGVRPQETRK